MVLRTDVYLTYRLRYRNVLESARYVPSHMCAIYDRYDDAHIMLPYASAARMADSRTNPHFLRYAIEFWTAIIFILIA